MILRLPDSGRYEPNYLVDRFRSLTPLLPPSPFLSLSYHTVSQARIVHSVEIILRLLRRLTAHAVVFLRDETPAAAVLDLQEALIAVRHAVGAAHGIVVRRADLLAAAEQETLDASLHGHDVHVFPGNKN